MAKETLKRYQEKLKDSRWQQKRLEIFNRDCWTCRKCGEKDDVHLHVHHLLYEKGDPWDIDSKYLLTLCEDCHEYEHRQRPLCEEGILREFKKLGFLSDDLVDIHHSFFLSAEANRSIEELTWVLREIMMYDESFQEMIERQKQRLRDLNLL